MTVSRIRASLAALALGCAFGAGASASAAIVDTTPPVLTAAVVSGNVNAASAGQSVTVALCATDDLSGVHHLNIILASPDGSQRVTQSRTIELPNKNVCVSEMMGVPRLNNPGISFSTTSQPGTWTVYYIQLTDMAGNESDYTQSQIAALGNRVTFVVTNSFYSTARPVLISGNIATPTVSLSVPPAYTPAGTLPLILMGMTVSDAVSPTVEGVDEVSATYCLPPVVYSQCVDGFILRGQGGQPIRAASKFNLSTQPSSSVTGGLVRTGTYSLFSVSLTDMAGNVTVYRDTAFGGTYNLASYFGGNKIVIKP